MIITNGTPKRMGFFLRVLLRGVVLSGLESNAPMTGATRVVDQGCLASPLWDEYTRVTLSAFPCFPPSRPPFRPHGHLKPLFPNNPIGMATDNQVALSRPTGGSPPGLSKEARKVVPAFLQKLYQCVAYVISLHLCAPEPTLCAGYLTTKKIQI